VSDKPHLSFSQANTYLRCGLQWYYRYARGERRPPGVALLVGSGTHEAVERDMRSKLDTGELLEDGAPQAIASESVTRRWAEEAPVLDGEDEAAALGAAIDLAASLAACHHKHIAPHIEPTHVERELVVDSPDLGLEIVCRVDIQTATTIHDTKTAAKAPSLGDLRSAQFGLYRAAIMATDGHAPDRIQLDGLVKTKVPKAVSIVAEVTDADASAALERLGAVAAGIAAGVFLPADPTSWVCSPKFCGWYDTCPQGSRSAVAVALVDPAKLSRVVKPRNLSWED